MHTTGPSGGFDRLWSGYARIKTFFKRLAPSPRKTREPVWKRNPCQKIPDSDGAETVEVWVWHVDDPKSAAVVRDYAEFAIADTWSDQYDVDVQIRATSKTAIREHGTDLQDAWFGFIQSRWGDPNAFAKDCNLLLLSHADNVGGGSIAVASTGNGVIGDLDADCIRRYGDQTEPHRRLGATLHEIGHCLGGSHEHGRDDGAVVRRDGKRFATLLKYTYADAPPVYEFSNLLQERGPDV
jgi:hypothetical protein